MVGPGRAVNPLFFGTPWAQLPHQFTGIDSPYEAPLAPDLEIRTDRESIADSVEKLTRLALSLARPTDQDGAGAHI